MFLSLLKLVSVIFLPVIFSQDEIDEGCSIELQIEKSINFATLKIENDYIRKDIEHRIESIPTFAYLTPWNSKGKLNFIFIYVTKICIT